MIARCGTLQAPATLARDWKNSLATGMEIFGISIDQLARMLNEHAATVAAWRSATKSNQVPAWIFSHRGLPAGLRAFLLACANDAAGEGTSVGAHTAESQAKVVVKRLAQLIGALAEALDGHEITVDEAIDLLPKVEKDMEALRALRERLLGVVARGVGASSQRGVA